jgi:hypothetical protein
MSLELFRLVGVGSGCWVVRDAPPSNHNHVLDVGYCIGRQRQAWRWTAGGIEAVCRASAWYRSHLPVIAGRTVAAVRVDVQNTVHAGCKLTSGQLQENCVICNYILWLRQGSWVSWVSIVMGYRLDDRGIGIRFLERWRDFFCTDSTPDLWSTQRAIQSVLRYSGRGVTSV